MAQLNLTTRKSFSDNNMKRIINILVGLMSNVSTLEEQCLNPYDETKTYSKNMICLYQNHLYLCKSATTGVFNPNSWEMQDDIINELSLDEVKNFLSLTPEQLTTLSSIIKDDSIELSKTWSSSKSYMEIDNALKEAKQYCLTQLASKSTGSFKIATSEAEVVDGNYLYLIMNAVTSKYDIYALVDGGIEKLTTVDVNLDNYFTKQEISDNYYDKSTSDGKFATITTVDNHISDTVAHMTQEEKDKLLTTDDMTTTIDSTSTDNQVVGALTTYNAFKELETKITVQNLFPATYHNLPEYTANGVTSTINDDGSITFNGTSTGTHFSVIYHRDYNGLGKAVKLRGKTLTLSGGKPSPVLSLAFYDEDGNNVTPPDNAMKYDTGKGLTITVPDNAYSIYSYYYISAGTYNNVTLYPMLEEGEVTHSFVSPKDTKLTKGDIVTTINHLSTDIQIPSAKASYDITKYNIIGLECPGDKSPLEFALENTVQNKIVYFRSWGNSTSDRGDSFSTYIAIRHNDDRYVELFSIPAYGKLKINNYQIDTWTGWQEVCTTSVNDVDETEINTTNSNLTKNGKCCYLVENGICYVSLWGIESSALGKQFVLGGMPKPKIKINSTVTYDENASDIGKHGGNSYIEYDGNLYLEVQKTNASLFGSFSYPVAKE